MSVYKVGADQSVGAIDSGSVTVTASKIPSQSKFSIELYHRLGGLKKRWTIGQKDCPVSKIEFETNLSGMGAGDITLNYVDVPIDLRDQWLFYIDGVLYWRGRVLKTPPDTGGSCECEPIRTIAEDILIKNDYVAGSTANYTSANVGNLISAIVQNELQANGIYYDPLQIDCNYFGLSITYSAKMKTIKSVLDDLIGKLDRRYWGVDENNILFVRKLPIAITTIVNNNRKPVFKSISVEESSEDVEYTRLQVYQKSGSGEVYIGQVGYSVAPDIEQITGMKEGKITCAAGLTSAQCLDYAQALINNQSIKKIISIDGVDVNQWAPKPYEYIQVQFPKAMRLATEIDCNSLTNWSSILGSLSLVSDRVEGTYSILFYSTGSDTITYSFNPILMKEYISKMSTMVKFDTTDTLYFFTANYYDGMSKTIKLIPNNYSLWQLLEIEIENKPLKSISIQSIFLGTFASMNIDRIQFYGWNDRVETGNINACKYTIEPGNFTCDLEIGSYKPMAQKQVYDYQVIIDQLENTVKI